MRAETVALNSARASRASPSRPLRDHSRWPVAIVVGIVVLSVAVQCLSSAQRFLEFDRTAIGAGQWWRLLTGNFVHYDWLHLAANIGALAVLGWLGVIRSHRVLLIVPLSAIAVGVAVYVWADGTATYRGISGVDSALLAWLLVTMAAQDRDPKAAVWISVLLLMGAKSIWEAATGQVLLPTSAPVGVEVVNITHVIGLAVGMLVATAPVAAQVLSGCRGRCLARRARCRP